MRRLHCCYRILFASIALPVLTLPTTRAAELDYQGDVTHVTTIDTLKQDGPYNKIWEPYLAKSSDKHYLAAYGLQISGNFVDGRQLVG